MQSKMWHLLLIVAANHFFHLLVFPVSLPRRKTAFLGTVFRTPTEPQLHSIHMPRCLNSWTAHKFICFPTEKVPSEPSIFGQSKDQSFLAKIRRAACPVCAVVGILVATTLCGYFTYDVTYDLQVTQFEDDYNSLADSAVVQLRKGLDDNIRGARVGAAVYSSTFPYVNAWPFVYLYNYDAVATVLNPGVMVNFAPLVKPEEATEFENFAYGSFDRTYETKVAQSSFGEGIFAPVNSSDFYGLRYHDILGNTTYGSPYRILAPILQGLTVNLMFNFHSDPLRGDAIDAMIHCTNNATSVSEMSACAAIAPPTYTLRDDAPVSFVLFPVFPMRNSTILTGLTFVSMRWNDLLQGLFPAYVSQMHCVLRADNVEMLFVIEHGKVVEVLEDPNAYQEEMSQYARIVPIVSRSNLQSASSSYTLTIYPTRRLRQEYVNDDPAYVTLIVVVVVLTFFLAIGCGLYFTRLQRRATKVAAVSKIKRLFIRYISHEIRTPLNTVSLGLNLLLSEITLDATTSASLSSAECTESTGSTPNTITENKRSDWCKLVAELIENSQCAVMLLDDLLTFEQFEQGSLASLEPTERQVLPVWELLQTAIASFGVRARLSDVQLVTSLEIDKQHASDGLEEIETSRAERKRALGALRVLGNETQLKRVINSLLSNALQFSHEGDQISITCCWIEHTDYTEEVLPQQGTNTPTGSSPPSTRQLALSRLSSHSSYRSTKSHTFTSSWDGTCAGMNRVGVVRVAVTDQGAGMTAEQTTQVFGKGKRFSLSALQAGQGSGIGLFVCKIIAEQHHATIKVTSPGVGLGSTYTLDLPVFVAPAQLLPSPQQDGSTKSVGLARSPRSSPRHRATSPRSAPVRDVSALATAWVKEQKEIELQQIPDTNLTPPPPPSTNTAASAAVTPRNATRGVSFGAVITIPAVPETPIIPEPFPFTHKRILVVDDAPSNRKMLVRVLAKQGHVCEQAHDGQVAVDMVQEAESINNPYDMILMDYEMPVMNGPTATARLRELGYTVPIVGVTGNVLCTDVEYFMAQGADAVLPKPLQLEALEAVWKKKQEEEQLLHQDGGLDNA